MSDTEESIESRFLSDIRDHKLEVIRDDGVYRHIKARKPGTGCYGFDIITWPGWLCYTGDMGSFVFQRLEDMFKFFRRNIPGADPEKLQINTGYWAEKAKAVDRDAGIRKFDADKFRATLIEIIEQDGEPKEGFREALQEEVLSAFEDGDEADARRVADRFEFDGKTVFQDLWDYDFQKYTYRFVWCCYAIAWTIRQYDALKAEPVEEIIRHFGGKVEGVFEQNSELRDALKLTATKLRDHGHDEFASWLEGQAFSKEGK